jgi:hypothetical protein
MDPIVKTDLQQEKAEIEPDINKPCCSKCWKLGGLVIGLLIVIGLFLNAYLIFSKKETITKTPDATITGATPTPDPTIGWKTYTNTKLGYEIKYPNDFFIKTKGTANDPFTYISNYPEFDKKETALFISIRRLGETDRFTSSESKIKALSGIGYSELSTKWSNKLNCDFFGDPPWGTYIIYFPSNNYEVKYISFSATIHRADDLTIKEGGTEGRDKLITRQILSTFKFIDQGKGIDTSNWKTYTNSNLNYSFKYPSYWTERKMENNQILFSEDYSGGIGDGSPLEIVITKDLSSDPAIRDINPTTKTINLSGKTVQELTYLVPDYYAEGEVAVVKCVQIFTGDQTQYLCSKYIKAGCVTDPEVLFEECNRHNVVLEKDSQLLIEQILSTFKFTP